MTLLDLIILLIAAILYFLAHLQFDMVVIGTLVALIIVRLLRGERVP